NITGPLRGSPLINLLMQNRLRWTAIRFLMWLRGRRPSLFTDFRYGSDAPLWEPLSPPPQLEIYHVMAFPLERHFPLAVTSFVEKKWWRIVDKLQMRKYGPHEGVTVLGDLLLEPGTIYPVWGVPHWIGPGWSIHPLLARLLMWIERQPVAAPLADDLAP